MAIGTVSHAVGSWVPVQSNSSRKRVRPARSPTAPVGLTPGGLPVGLQIVGPYLEDATPIAVAGHLADVIGGFKAPPGF